MRTKALSVILSVILLLSLCSCVPVSTQKSDRLSVVCSIFAPYDFARRIAGDRADVIMILPPGVESHSYEPAPSDIIDIRNADLFIFISENCETWVPQLTDAAEEDNLNSVNLAKELGIEIHHHRHHTGEEKSETACHDENSKEADEHIWTNLQWSMQMISVIADKMAEADRENGDFYKQNADAYISDISSLENDFTELVKNSKRKEIVSGSRFALKNFVNEFGLQYTAAFDSCVDNTEPSAAVMAKIIDKTEADNIPVIFYEELTEPKIARAVSLETGAKMLLLHSCHNVTADEYKAGKTYLDIMKQNYRNLKEALN